MKKSRKNSIEKKLAVALSVVNALNVAAPIVLPYANVAKNVCTEGGHAKRLPDALARSLYGTAQAECTPEVNSGQKVQWEWVTSGEVQTVNSSGVALSTTITGGGIQTVNSGGGAYYTTIKNGGTQIVNSSGDAGFTTVNNGGTLLASSGGFIEYTTIESGGVASGGDVTRRQDIKKGGIVRDAVITSGGCQFVSGLAQNITIHEDIKSGYYYYTQYQDIVSGGVASGCTVKNGQNVEKGGTAKDTVLIGVNANQIVQGTAINTIVSGGFQKVCSGAQVSGVHIKQGAVQVITGGGSVSGVHISAGGTQYVSAGGTGSVDTFEGGTIWMKDGALFSGNITGYGKLSNVSMGGTVTATGGAITGDNVTAGVLSVAEGGSVALTKDLNASTISLGTTPTSMDPLVSAGGNITVDTVDFTGLKAKDKNVEEYTFITAGGTLSALTVKRNNLSATLKAGSEIKNQISNESVTPKAALTLGYEVANTLYHNGNALRYEYARSSDYKNATFDGTIPWTPNETYFDAKAEGYDFESNASVDLSNLAFSFTQDRVKNLAPDQSMTLLSGLPGTPKLTGTAPGSFGVSLAGVNTVLSATAKGGASVSGDAVKYTVSGVTLDKVNVTGVTDTTDEVPSGWTKNADGVLVDTDSLSVAPDGLTGSYPLLTADNPFFTDDKISGSYKYQDKATFSHPRNGVTLGGAWSRGVQTADGGKSLVFTASSVSVDTVALGAIPWKDGASLRPNAGLEVFDYGAVDGVDTTNFSVENPADAGAGESMTLLTANSTLKDMAAETKTAHYAYSPVSGVTVTGGLTGQLEAKNGDLTFSAAKNQASTLAFRGVNWTGDTPLMTRSEKITFNGATADTSKITFTNVSDLKKGDVTTLVANYDGKPGAIVGDKYRIGTAFEGAGKASMDGNNLIFTAESAPSSSEQTHNALMGAGAGMVALSAGNDFVESATGGLGQAANTGSDGVSTYAQMGGGSTRQETGSHVDVHGWNAILALGHKNEKEKSAFEYGAFFEYGNGNYTTHNGDLRGDGSVNYTGGGLLAKWTAKHGLYVEGSLRAGNMHGETNGVLRDIFDNPYHYEINMPYWGLHLGVGRELDLGHGNTLDIYGKYFMNRRNSVDFTAGEARYDLDALTSHILRVGARYTMKRDNWNYYGGLAYEHELDGKASGTVSNGVISAAIRGTDPTGGSVRMELGATMKPENSPWTLDLNLAGFAGKKRGITGGVSVSLMF